MRDKAFIRTGSDGRNPALALAAIFCQEIIVLFFLCDLNVLLLHAPVTLVQLVSYVTTWQHIAITITLKPHVTKKTTAKPSHLINCMQGELSEQSISAEGEGLIKNLFDVRFLHANN